MEFIRKKQADFLFIGLDMQWAARLKPFPLRLTVSGTELVKLKPGWNSFSFKHGVHKILRAVRFERGIDVAVRHEAVLVFLHLPQNLAAGGVDIKDER